MTKQKPLYSIYLGRPDGSISKLVCDSSLTHRAFHVGFRAFCEEGEVDQMVERLWSAVSRIGEEGRKTHYQFLFLSLECCIKKLSWGPILDAHLRVRMGKASSRAVKPKLEAPVTVRAEWSWLSRLQWLRDALHPSHLGLLGDLSVSAQVPSGAARLWI